VCVMAVACEGKKSIDDEASAMLALAFGIDSAEARAVVVVVEEGEASEGEAVR
jgi:hypothetical protein